MTPKIIFRYSFIYDGLLSTGFKFLKYPSDKKIEEILDYIKKIEKIWRKDESKLLKEFSKITELKWKEKQIYCYVVGKCIPFSDPLTIPIYNKYPNLFIDTLIHELIHQIFIQSFRKSKKAWKYIDSKYKKENKKTRIHIPLYAISSHIYLKFYNKNKLKEIIKSAKYFSDAENYMRAWEIVQKEGYQNIINEFRKRIKN